MLQQAADPADRQQLEKAFALERARATKQLMQRTAEHESAVRKRCNQLKIATLDKRQVLAGKSKPSLLYGQRSCDVPPPKPLHSRNWPVQIETNDEEVIVTWAARHAIRANRNAKVLPGVFPSKSNPSPFASTQKLHDKNNEVYPMSSTPLPGRCSPLLAAKEDPAVTGPFLRQRNASPQAEIIIFDSAPATPLMRSGIAREDSAEMRAESHSAPLILADMSGGASTESIGEQSSGPVTPGSRPVGSLSPYRGVSSGSASRRMKSTSPILGGTTLHRGISVSSLQSALSASFSEQNSRPGTSLTATRDRCVQWEEAAKEHIASTTPSNLENMRGELFTEADVAATMTHAQIEVTKREIIRTAVDLPTGSALGLLSHDRPVTVQVNQELSQSAKELLTSNLSMSAPGSLRHNRHHTFHRRAVACRPISQRQNKRHYDNVRLRTIICDLIDRVLANGDTEMQETHEKALGDSVAQLAEGDLTSSLSMFPGILQVLFSVLERTKSQLSRLAVAKGLLHLARQSQVQLTLIQGNYLRREEAIRFPDLLQELIAHCTDGSINLIYAELIACLCRSEVGFETCSQSGLLSLIERIGSESGDPAMRNILHNVKDGRDGVRSGDTSIACFDATRQSSSLEERTGKQASFSMGSDQSASPPDPADRRKWKPSSEAALPLWERPQDVMGVTSKRWATSSSKLRRPASPRHRE